MNINLTIVCTTTTSYGISSLNILKSLMDLGHTVSIFPINSLDQINHEAQTSEAIRPFIPYIQSGLSNANGLNFDYNAPSVRIWHQHHLSQHVGNGKRASWSIFELDRFNDLEKMHLGAQDKLIVCSDWARNVVLKHFKDENFVSTVPLGTDRTIFNENVKPYCNQSNRTIFLNIGKYEVRKGHDILPVAFRRAFKTTDLVELWMMPHNPFLNEEEILNWEKLYKGILGNQVKILPRVDTPQQLAKIMAGADCLVHPSRAEGWDLPLLDAMSIGLNVIATNYSAHTEYCDVNNSHLINIQNTIPAHDSKWFFGAGNWADLGDNEINQCARWMSKIHTLKQDGDLRVNTKAIEMAKNFTWENSARKLVEVLESI
jgi:glycosyltransferase involved in cell wall biosynthesis